MNCSQKLISLIFGTTFIFQGGQGAGLWIALKSWYLWYSEQRDVGNVVADMSCELLSKVDIFDIRNNAKQYRSKYKMVVNCSQKLISLIFGTTWKLWHSHGLWLWIALKSWYLWYSEQRQINECKCYNRCELLSKVDIFDIRNNSQ